LAQAREKELRENFLWDSQGKFLSVLLKKNLEKFSFGTSKGIFSNFFLKRT